MCVYLKTYSVCPWKTLTECMDGSLKSHNLKVVSLDEVTTNRWVGWVQQWVNSWSWPAHTARNQPSSQVMGGVRYYCGNIHATIKLAYILKRLMKHESKVVGKLL